MRKQVLAVAMAAAVLGPGVALAQNDPVSGTARGIEHGATTGGPVGAIVGGAAGAVSGTANMLLGPPPAEVRTYVMRERVPSVAVEERIVVGQPLPPRVKLHTVRGHDAYSYAIVNEQRVVVDPRTRRVIEIYE
ncbi:DUF1236 domain-containing protein [Rhodoplanes serenus]|jgi:hypothetical protein|uniref:DUF1236 domain-containing protein n=1 Tax=Rhodoplanes serenus TaxID=200615 RepID=A0A327JTS3_9BRAD|nr:DUF1236 domain-containing protein [Rhodoplanes serenus]MBI5114115.1 DUF1236 domain-containing protein [Rhodovulum sp.]MTW15342.1 DUF1236 domain-containing protein [Rhodoplanes serenus]RAI28874.1 hypothetical protein CH340_23280 [Rhodoplanes serenus]VCU06929.1 hypothetical protein RHODGE_RHODGE_00019 [Rhodoplanes serenus]